MAHNPSSNPFLRYKLLDAAKDGAVVTRYCRHCKRVAVFLAADLITFRDPFVAIEDLFMGTCGNCGKTGYVSTRSRPTTSDDVGNLRIMRPDGFRKIRLWKEEWYGPQPPFEVTDEFWEEARQRRLNKR